MLNPTPLSSRYADRSVESLTNLSLASQRQLDALRATLETRLSALESALANPDAGQSLEGLILELSRAATDEAEAAAYRACVDTTLDSERRLATARAAHEIALEAEASASSHLRAALVAAEEKLHARERENAADIQALSERVETQRVAQQAIAANAERALGKALHDLETERTSSAGLAQQVVQAREWAATLETENGRAFSAEQTLALEVERERAAAIDLRRALDELRHQQDTEQAATALVVRADLDRAHERIAILETEKSREHATQQKLTAELNRGDAKVAELQHVLEKVQRHLGTERAAAENLRAELADARARLSGVQSDGISDFGQQAAEDLARERSVAADLRHALDETAHQLDAARTEAAALRSEIAEARERTAALERENGRSASAWQELTTELTRERAASADLHRSLGEATQHLDAERRASRTLRADMNEARERTAAMETEKGRGRVAVQELTAELDRERATAAELRQAIDEPKRHLIAEQTVAAGLRAEIAEARERLITLEWEKGHGLAAQQNLTDELAHERAVAAAFQQQLHQLRESLEAELTTGADLRAEMARAQERIVVLESDRGRELAKLQGLTTELARERAAAADLQELLRKARTEMSVPRPPLPEVRRSVGPSELRRPTADGERAFKVQAFTEYPVIAPTIQDTRLDANPRAHTSGDGSKMRPRQARRCAFRLQSPVQIDNGSGLLVDLSVRGCQILSPEFLEFNRVVKIQLLSSDAPVACIGKVAWTRLERSSTGQSSYRAGLLFTRANESALQTFLASHVVSHVGCFQ